MRFGFISDICGNHIALAAVLRRLEREGIRHVFCLGDIVGPRGDANACVDLIRSKCLASVAGEGDHFVCGKMAYDGFDPFARSIMDRTVSQVSAENRKWLASLPLVRKFDGFMLVHSSACDPEAFFYVTTVDDAQFCFQAMDRALLFFGHIRIQMAFFGRDPVEFSRGPVLSIPNDARAIVGVGSVGISMDREDHFARFAIFDEDRKEVRLEKVETV